MASEIERLVVRLEVSQAKFEKQMANASRSADRSAKRIEGRFQRMNKTLSSTFGALQGVMYKAFAAAAALRGAQVLIDSSIRIENALRIAGLAGAELTGVYDQLFISAQKNAAPIESLAKLYGKVALVQKELGISQEELLGFTENVSVALRVNGASAEASAGALLQLSQALGSGTVRAEEFNSIMEGAQPIALAAAAGIKEAGGSVAKLRQLVIDGKLSSEALFRGFEAGSVILETKLAGATFTVSQHMVQLQNALIDTAGKLDKASGASEILGGAIDSVTITITSAGNALDHFNSGPLARFIKDASKGAGAAENLVEKLTGLPALLAAAQLSGQVMSDVMMGRKPGASIEIAAGDAKLADSNAALQSALDKKYGPQKTTPTTGRIARAVDVTPVSINDYKIPASTKKSKAGSAKKIDEYAREIAQVKEHTDALTAQTLAMQGVNPLIDDYGFALEKARTVQELTSAATKAGIPITKTLAADIDTLATSYAQASVDAEKLAESQDKARQSAEDMKALGKDVMGGFIKDLQAGKSASEALAGALSKVADKLLDVALNSIFDGGGGGLGGIFGGIASILGFAGGTNNAPGGLAIVGERGPELVNLPKGSQVTPSIDTKAMLANKGGGVNVPVNISIDATGADAAGLARVEAQLQKLRSGLPGQIVSTVRDARTRRIIS